MKLVEDMCPLPEAVQKCPLSFVLPIIFRLRIISSMVVLAPKGKFYCVCGCYCWFGIS